MTKVLITESILQDTADAIREKSGSSDTMTPSEFASNIESLPSGGGSVPQTLTELVAIKDNFDLYLNSLVSEYASYTDEPMTIYTPDATCTHFMIQKRNGDKYRIVWSTYGYYVWLKSSGNQSFVNIYLYPATTTNSRIYLSLTNYPIKINDYVKSGNANRENAYYSNDFDTLEDLITALKSPSASGITYTSYTSGFNYTGILDSDWGTPITNVPVFESDGVTPLINGRVLSHNLTILPL